MYYYSWYLHTAMIVFRWCCSRLKPGLPRITCCPPSQNARIRTSPHSRWLIRELATQHIKTLGLCGFVRDNYCARSSSSSSSRNPSKSRKKPAEELYGSLIYTGPINKALLLVKSLCVSTSIFGLALQSGIFMQLLPETKSAGLIGVAELLILPVIMSPFLLHFVAKRYVLELYFRPADQVCFGNYSSSRTYIGLEHPSWFSTNCSSKI